MLTKYPSLRTYPPQVGLRPLRNLHAAARRDIALPPHVRERTGFTALMVAARHGTAPLVCALVADGENIDARDTIFGRTALMWAVSQRHARPSVVRALLARRADVHATDFWGRTALWWAAWWKHAALVRLLLRHGADVNAARPNGETVLIAAAKRGDVETVRTLLEHGARVDDTDARGWSALQWAAERRNKAVTGLLSLGRDRLE